MKIRNLVGDRAFYRSMFSVMLPVLAQNIITNFVNLLDNIMVGQVGTEPMSGVAIVNQLLFVFNLCAMSGVAGAGILTAQFYGKGDTEGLRFSFRMKLLISLLNFGVFAGLFAFKGDALISLFLHEGQEALDLAATLEYGRAYLAVMLFQMLPFSLIQVYAGTLRETGETVLPMKAGILAVFVNLILNYILIFGKLGAPAMGVTGAAAATVIARISEALVVIIATHRHGEKNQYIEGVYSSLYIPRPVMKKVAVMGLPLLLNELLWSGGMTVLSQCYSLRGLEAVSAVNISVTVSQLFFCAYFAMGTTLSIMVGQLLGAGELEKAVDTDRKLIAFSVALCIVVGAIMAVLAPFIPEMYNTTAAVRKLARNMIFVSAALMPVNAFTHNCYFTLRTGGKTAVTFIFDSLFVWAVNIPTALILSRLTDMAILPMYIIVQAQVIIKASVGFMLVKSGKWVRTLVND
ncbi:MAG: MATE family efflux transporter [Candidatus Limivicinus sp.]|jgi:putative MATE family efflux protein